jgi:hypothetical protein
MHMFVSKKCWTFFTVTLLLFSCSDRTLSESKEAEINAVLEVNQLRMETYEFDDFFDSSCQRIESLNFSNDYEERKAYFWYQGDSLVGARELFSNIKSGVFMETSFYFKNGKIHTVLEIIDDSQDSLRKNTSEFLTAFVDGKPTKTWKNYWSSDENDSDPLGYIEEKTARSYNLEHAFDMLNHQGEYQLYFHDFLVNEYDTYLLLETHGKQEFIAALKVTEVNEFIDKLYSNKAAYKKKPVLVQYETVIHQGWTYNHYKNGMLGVE